MERRFSISRRGFMEGVAGAAATLALTPERATRAQDVTGLAPRTQRPRPAEDEYDKLAKLHFNENPYGPPESVVAAMTKGFKYANRYAYPDGNLQDEIAKLHGVPAENVLLASGSGEILDAVGSAYVDNGKRVVGAEPSYAQVYQHVTQVKGAGIMVPLTADYRQDIPATVTITRMRYRDVAFVYLCNPNNPTGRIVTSAEIKQLLDGIPMDVPVLIDEAYHHFVEDPAYATSIPLVKEGRPIIVTRTFSKIAALAGMRLGYAIAPRDVIQRLRVCMTGTINAAVRWGGVAAIRDTASETWVKKVTLEQRKRTVAELERQGYPCIPSEANFFMVHVKRKSAPLVDEFQKRGVLVGRPFPPMNEHLRVSIGAPAEMDRFLVAWKEIMALPKSATGG